MNAGVYLQSYLAPLAPWLEAGDITDILINRPGEIWIERQGGATETIAVPALSEQVLVRLARQVAASSDQGINREQPLLSATLPDGARIQIVGPPATRGGTPSRPSGTRAHAPPASPSSSSRSAARPSSSRRFST